MSAALNNAVRSIPRCSSATAGCARAHALPLRSDEDVVGLRKHVRERAVAIALSLVDQTKLVTAASELARNTIKYGGGGEVTSTPGRWLQARGRPDLRG
jgi:serine/threonine-protein kinase RsbT